MQSSPRCCSAGFRKAVLQECAELGSRERFTQRLSREQSVFITPARLIAQNRGNATEFYSLRNTSSLPCKVVVSVSVRKRGSRPLTNDRLSPNIGCCMTRSPLKSLSPLQQLGETRRALPAQHPAASARQVSVSSRSPELRRRLSSHKLALDLSVRPQMELVVPRGRTRCRTTTEACRWLPAMKHMTRWKKEGSGPLCGLCREDSVNFASVVGVAAPQLRPDKHFPLLYPTYVRCWPTRNKSCANSNVLTESRSTLENSKGVETLLLQGREMIPRKFGLN